MHTYQVNTPSNNIATRSNSIIEHPSNRESLPEWCKRIVQPHSLYNKTTYSKLNYAMEIKVHVNKHYKDYLERNHNTLSESKYGFFSIRTLHSSYMTTVAHHE